MAKVLVVLALAASLSALAPAASEAWSGGPVFQVTDINPNCAACHSAVTKEQHRTEPPGMANFVFVENRHYKAIETGSGPYQAMSPADRQKLLADVKVVDQNASVTLTAPATTQPGQEVQVTATVRGGNEFVAVALVDTDLQQKARIIQADGWRIIGPPQVWGSDGAAQTKWVDARGALPKNINSALIFDQKADLSAKKFAGGKATWTLKAPQEPGTYSIAAVMFYGTEKASAGGAVTTAGQVTPRGGNWGASGRIMFAKPVMVTVR
jgi:hypothetical protein